MQWRKCSRCCFSRPNAQVHLTASRAPGEASEIGRQESAAGGSGATPCWVTPPLDALLFEFVKDGKSTKLYADGRIEGPWPPPGGALVMNSAWQLLLSLWSFAREQHLAGVVGAAKQDKADV